MNYSNNNNNTDPNNNNDSDSNIFHGNVADKVVNILTDKLGRPSGKFPELLFFCPNCSHHKRKLQINFNTEEFNCWVCASDKINKPTAGKSFYLLFKKLHLQVPSFIKVPDLYSGGTSIISSDLTISSLRQRMNKVLGTDEIHSEKIFDSEFKQKFKSVFKVSDPVMKRLYFAFLHSRGLSDEEIAKYNIGVFESDNKFAGRIIIPSYNQNGNINYYIARSVLPIYHPKYMNPAEEKAFIFNELFIDFTKPVYIVEGFFDAIKLQNAIPLAGSVLDKNSRLVHAIIHNKTPTIISLDSDAYIKQINMIKKIFVNYGIDHKFIFNRTNKDFGSMTATEVSSILSTESNNKFDILRERIFRRT